MWGQIGDKEASGAFRRDMAWESQTLSAVLGKPHQICPTHDLLYLLPHHHSE